MTTKTRAPKARTLDPSNPDAAFFKLHNEWDATYTVHLDATAKADGIEFALRRKLPPLPQLAIALDCHPEALIRQLEERRKDVLDCEKKLHGCVPEFTFNSIRACDQLLAKLREHEEAKREIQERPEIKRLRAEASAAHRRMTELFEKVINTPASSPEALFAKFKMTTDYEIGAKADLADNPELDWNERATFSLARDLRRLVGKGGVS